MLQFRSPALPRQPEANPCREKREQANRGQPAKSGSKAVPLLRASHTGLRALQSPGSPVSYSCGKKGIPRSSLADQEAGRDAKCLSLFQNREEILLVYAGDRGLRHCSTGRGRREKRRWGPRLWSQRTMGGGRPWQEKGRGVAEGKSRRMLLPHLIWMYPLRYNRREITACPAHREIPSERTEHPRKGRPGEMGPRAQESELLPDPGGCGLTNSRGHQLGLARRLSTGVPAARTNRPAPDGTRTAPEPLGAAVPLGRQEGPRSPDQASGGPAH